MKGLPRPERGGSLFCFPPRVSSLFEREDDGLAICYNSIIPYILPFATPSGQTRSVVCQERP